MPGAVRRNPIVVALLFAVSGVITFLLLRTWNPGFYLGGITFGLLAGFLFVRFKKFWPVIVLQMDLVWMAAWRSAVFLIVDWRWNAYLGMMVAGVIGGLGVAASSGVGRRELLAVRYLAILAAVGAIAALPFGWWEQKNSDSPLLWCFAIWQSVVGVTLWACNSRLVSLPDKAPDL